MSIDVDDGFQQRMQLFRLTREMVYQTLNFADKDFKSSSPNGVQCRCAIKFIEDQTVAVYYQENSFHRLVRLISCAAKQGRVSSDEFVGGVHADPVESSSNLRINQKGFYKKKYDKKDSKDLLY